MSICKGHIYIITCHVNPKIYYIGSTYDNINQKWLYHKRYYKNNNGEMIIHKYFDEYGIENFSIKLIKSYNVYKEHNDNKHLRAYEQLWKNKLKGCCNNHIVFQPLKKQLQKQYNKEYREKQKILHN